jgi:hypothetical protein
MLPENALMRRLKRHASLATILRSPSPSLNRWSTIPAGSEVGNHPASVVKAFILQTASPFPAGYVSAPVPILGNDLAPIMPPSQQQPSAILAAATSFSEVGPLTRSTAAASSHLVEAPALQETLAEAPEVDPTWRRLQTILHRHEQKQAAENAGSESTTQQTLRSPLPETDAAITQSGSVEQQPENHKTRTNTFPAVPTPTVEIIQRQDLIAASHPLPNRPSAFTQNTQNESIQPDKTHGPAITSEVPTQITQRPIAPDTLPTRPAVPDRDATHPDPRIPAPQTLASEPSEKPASLTPLSCASPQDAKAIRGDRPLVALSSLNDTAVSPLQPWPLESAWPVQSSRSIQREAASPPVNGVLKQSLNGMRQILREVAPGQPTDSPVETLPPRQPRPNLTPPTIVSNLTLTPDEPPPTTVQRRVEIELQAPSSEMIPTDIGPLPSDLWQLVGHTVPESSPEKAKRGENTPSEVVSPTNSPSLASGQTQPPISMQSQVEMPNLIQRQVEAPTTGQVEAENLTAIAAINAQPGAGSPIGHVSVGINLEELARKVYGEVRRRLAIERERIRW